MCDQIDPYFQPNLIKKDITGFDNGLMKTYRSMSPFFPTPEIAIPIRVNTCAGHLCIWRNDPRFQPRNGSNDFEYGTRRILTLDPFVLERVARIFHERFPFFG
jgi:hypothetical protein